MVRDLETCLPSEVASNFLSVYGGLWGGGGWGALDYYIRDSAEINYDFLSQPFVSDICREFILYPDVALSKSNQNMFISTTSYMIHQHLYCKAILYIPVCYQPRKCDERT